MIFNKKPVTKEEQLTEDDLMFLKLVLPRGIIRESWMLRANEVCRTFLVAYRYPAYLEDLAYSRMHAQKKPGVVITLDITPTSTSTAKAEIRKSMDELRSRAAISRSDGDNIDDAISYDDMASLHVAISRANERIVSQTLRFLVCAPTPKELRKKVEEVQKQLQDYGIETFLPENEMIPEHRSLVSPADTAQTSFPLRGTLTRQFPFRAESLMDPTGLYLGYTNTGGQVYLDTTIQTQERRSFDVMLWGVKGSGKTATMKELIQHMVCCGNRVFCLTIEPEFDGLVKAIGGRTIDPYSTDARINMFQLPLHVDTSGDDQIVEEDSVKANLTAYTTNTARIMEFFQFFQPEMSGLIAEELRLCIHATYKRFGISEKSDRAKLQSEEYPRLRDLRDQIRSLLYLPGTEPARQNLDLSENKRQILETLETYVSAICYDGPCLDLFDCYSTCRLEDERFVVFDLMKIRSQGDRLYNAYLHNVISMCWEQLPANKLRNQRQSNELDRSNIAIVIPEAHSMLSENNPQGTAFIEQLVRRARKYDAGIWFDSQHASDFFPRHESPIAEKIRAIFSMVQYKAVLRQDGADKAALRQLMPHMTDSELDATTVFQPGQMLLSIGSETKLRLQCYVPDEDLALFAGGREK